MNDASPPRLSPPKITRARAHHFQSYGPCELPTPFGAFMLRGVEGRDGRAICLLEFGAPQSVEAPLVRLHSACLTGESFFSSRCDCRDQLSAAMEAIAQAGAGVIAYLDQEGRGIGILEKIEAYALQDFGYDTADANLALGHVIDGRDYSHAAEALKMRGLTKIRLMTNNPDKCAALTRHGIEIVERIALWPAIHGDNQRYIRTKITKMGHLAPCGS